MYLPLKQPCWLELVIDFEAALNTHKRDKHSCGSKPEQVTVKKAPGSQQNNAGWPSRAVKQFQVERGAQCSCWQIVA
jgi:hypothetical protein